MQAGAYGLVLSPVSSFAGGIVDVSSETKRRLLYTEDHTDLDLPEGKRIPFGWPAFGIAPGERVTFRLQEKLNGRNLWLRVSVALEVWENKLLHIHIPYPNIYLGAIDIRYSAVLVPYELEIDAKYANLIQVYGLSMTLEGSTPLWIFNGFAAKEDNSAFLPCLLDSEEKRGSREDFLNCFMSVNSVQSFAWREGCVLDGLWQVYDQKGEERALEAIYKHFDLFFDEDQNLVYESARSAPKDNQIGGTEFALPFAVLAKTNPNHPILRKTVQTWGGWRKHTQMTPGNRSFKAEGCYTVAYPMAAIGKAWGDDELMKRSLDYLRRSFVLMHEEQLYLQYYRGERYFKNWARGIAWFLLGYVRTISELKTNVVDEEIVQKFRKGVNIALSYQNKNGLWNCFVDDNQSLSDTSGSAGIAAAILTGVRGGFLPEEYKKPALKCWDSLQDYLTPDGYLKGAAQDNRGGMELQRGEYRVIAQMGMGLMAQVYAEIEKID